jgi:hypothetical protein
MGSERDAAIANMESMGFARADIDRAMRAAFFNPDRAVEYLLTVRYPVISHSFNANSGRRASRRVLNRSSKQRLAKRVVRLLRHLPPGVTQAPPLPRLRVISHKIFSIWLLRLDSKDVEAAAVVLVQELPQGLEQAARSAAIVWNSCVTTRNFSNYDRSYNSSHKCLSLSSNKLALATLSWLS